MEKQMGLVKMHVMQVKSLVLWDFKTGDPYDVLKKLGNQGLLVDLTLESQRLVSFVLTFIDCLLVCEKHLGSFVLTFIDCLVVCEKHLGRESAHASETRCLLLQAIEFFFCVNWLWRRPQQ